MSTYGFKLGYAALLCLLALAGCSKSEPLTLPKGVDGEKSVIEVEEREQTVPEAEAEPQTEEEARVEANLVALDTLMEGDYGDGEILDDPAAPVVEDDGSGFVAGDALDVRELWSGSTKVSYLSGSMDGDFAIRVVDVDASEESDDQGEMVIVASADVDGERVSQSVTVSVDGLSNDPYVVFDEIDADATVSVLVESDELVDEMVSSWQTGDGAE